MFKTFKSWKDTSSTSSHGEDFEYQSSNNHIENVGVTNEPQNQRKLKSKSKLSRPDALQSIQSKDTNTYLETFNSYEYRKPDEQNVIAEDEDETLELNAKSEIFPLPYTHHSSKNTEIRPDITAHVSEESAYVNDLPTRNEKRHVNKKHARKNMAYDSEKLVNLKAEPNSNSIEINNSAHSKDTVNPGHSKSHKINKQKFKHDATPEYLTNSKEANSREGEAVSSESNDNAGPLSNAFGVPMPSPNKDSKPRKLTHHPHRTQKYSTKNKNINARHEIDPNSNGIPDYAAKNTIKDVQAPNTYDSMIRNKQLDNSEVLNQTPHVSQNYGKHSVVQEQIANALSQTNVNRDASIQETLGNTPNAAYNPYGYLSGQNQIADAKVLPPGTMPFPMVPYPYALPNFFVNSKLDGSLSPLNTLNKNVITAYNTYGAPGYSVKNSFGIAQEQVRSATVNNPSLAGIPNSPNYSRKSNTGTGQDQMKFTANSGNNPNPNSYQGAPNYSAQNTIGSQQLIAGNMEHSNPAAAYPYAPQYSDTNKPGETRDTGSSLKNDVNQNAAANSLHIASNYQMDKKIGGPQAQIPALPLINPNPFGGMFSPKEKFPVIQDPRIETLMKNTNINPGPPFNPYLTYPVNIQTPMAASVQNLQQLQDITAPNLAQNNLNMQGRQLSLQNNPLPNIISPGVALNSNKEAQRYQSNTIHKESLKEQNSPYVNSQQPDRNSHDTMSSKQKDTQTQALPLRANNIANTYLPNEISKKSHEKVDHKTPIMMQTNDDEIMPLGIPIHIKGDSKFNMRLIQNQHIIVTTTARPRSRMDHWNHYKLTKDVRTKDQREEKNLSPSAIYHPQQRVRPPMTHHDFEDLPSSQEPSNYHREDFNNMRQRIGPEFESRHQYSPENRLNYNPEMQEVGYTRHRSDQPEKVSLFRNQERMHDSINTGHLTIAQRHQVPLKRPQVNFDDTHFQNFLKTQEKVNDMLERILATRPKNLSLEPFKNI